MRAAGREFQCSSASRKFLNLPLVSDTARRTQFQCSSASRKFLNLYDVHSIARAQKKFQCSSASRKFLNLLHSCTSTAVRRSFQCSSASRKFLNPPVHAGPPAHPARFSALQRAENFSICDSARPLRRSHGFSALQRAENFSIETANSAANTIFDVSVLFSEPKISQ